MKQIHTKILTYKQWEWAMQPSPYYLKHFDLYLSVFYVDFNEYVNPEAIVNYICLVLNDTYIFYLVVACHLQSILHNVGENHRSLLFFIHFEHILLQIMDITKISR